MAHGLDDRWDIGVGGTFVVPSGATALFFGLPDANGFNGASGFYADNSGSFTVQISAVPEASTWAMMILGFCGVGFMAYVIVCVISAILFCGCGTTEYE